MAEHAPHSSTSSPRLRVVVVTPEQTVLDAPTDFVALPLYDGELGVAPGHAPMIGRLGYGELRIGHEPTEPAVLRRRRLRAGGRQRRLGAHQSSHPGEEARPGDIQESLAQAKTIQAAGDEEIARRERLVTQARAQLRVARGRRILA